MVVDEEDEGGGSVLPEQDLVWRSSGKWQNSLLTGRSSEENSMSTRRWRRHESQKPVTGLQVLREEE